MRNIVIIPLHFPDYHKPVTPCALSSLYLLFCPIPYQVSKRDIEGGSNRWGLPVLSGPTSPPLATEKGKLKTTFAYLCTLPVNTQLGEWIEIEKVFDKRVWIASKIKHTGCVSLAHPSVSAPG